MPRLGEPRQGWEEFTSGEEDGGVSELCASSLAGQECDAAPAHSCCGPEQWHREGNTSAHPTRACVEGLCK